MVKRALRWKISKFSEVSSTQDLAKEYVRREMLLNSVFVAETQTEGRGRHGRIWHSSKGGLYMTVILKLEGKICLLPILAGVAVTEAIKNITGIETWLKWPNDIYVHNRKVGGILAESSWRNNDLSFILLGIGVNVNNTLSGHEREATSISLELNSKVNINKLMLHILEKLSQYLPYLESKPVYIIQEWRKYNKTLGRNVEVLLDSGDIIRGLASDINEDGSLVVNTRFGVKKIISGSLKTIKFLSV